MRGSDTFDIHINQGEIKDISILGRYSETLLQDMHLRNAIKNTIVQVPNTIVSIYLTSFEGIEALYSLIAHSASIPCLIRLYYDNDYLMNTSNTSTKQNITIEQILSYDNVIAIKLDSNAINFALSTSYTIIAPWPKLGMRDISIIRSACLDSASIGHKLVFVSSYGSVVAHVDNYTLSTNSTVSVEAVFQSVTDAFSQMRYKE